MTKIINRPKHTGLFLFNVVIFDEAQCRDGTGREFSVPVRSRAGGFKLKPNSVLEGLIIGLDGLF